MSARVFQPSGGVIKIDLCACCLLPSISGPFWKKKDATVNILMLPSNAWVCNMSFFPLVLTFSLVWRNDSQSSSPQFKTITLFKMMRTWLSFDHTWWSNENQYSGASFTFPFPTPPLSSKHLYKSLSALLTLSRATLSFLSAEKASPPCSQSAD